MKHKLLYIILTLISLAEADKINLTNEFKISRIHYDGGGDWYADPSSISNLLNFISKNTDIETTKEEEVIKIGDYNCLFGVKLTILSLNIMCIWQVSQLPYIKRKKQSGHSC